MIKKRYYNSSNKQPNILPSNNSPLIPLAIVVAAYRPQEIIKLAGQLIHPPKKKEIRHRWEKELDSDYDIDIPTPEELAILLEPCIDDCLLTL